MFKTLFLKRKGQNQGVDEILEKIKMGDISLRNDFIADYKPFIIKCVSRFTKHFIEIENSDEYSIGLSAFNEAISCFDGKKSNNFFVFAEQVIRRRLVNYFLSSNKKGAKVFPFTYFENHPDPSFQSKYLEIFTAQSMDNFDIKEELAIFKAQLADFGISMNDLLLTAPKRKDAIKNSIKIAKLIADNEELYQKLESKKTLPITDILKIDKVGQRTLERHRKYIIAASLILRSNLEIIKAFLTDTEGGE